MSTVSPSQDQIAPRASHLPSSQSQPPKSQRVLACVLCQQRKVKCDRRFPCANCIKSTAQCVPATQARRRRRRFPERELLGRLRKYEDLLRQHNVEFEALHKDPTLGEKESPEGYDESDDEQPDAMVTDRSSLSASLKSESAHKTMSVTPSTCESRLPPSSVSHPPPVLLFNLIHEVLWAGFNVSDFTRNIWQAMSQEAQGPNDTSDSPIASVLESTVKNTLDQLTDDDHILFGSRMTAVDISTFHPGPVDIFRLWQVYLDNVNPLFKVTHTPSLQGRIIEAASNVMNISPALEALMFGIYCVSTLSLDGDDCQAMFGLSKEDLLTKYQFGCQQALMNAKYLRTADRDCLTALFLYLLSFRTGTNPRSLSSMLGVAVRIAQCMGIHNESSLAKYSVFEAEMRRRLWWSLMLYDTRMSEKADHKDASLAPTWDCRIPLNVNDSDLRAEMKESPASKGTATEALFIVVRSELADFVRHTSFHLDFTNPALKAMAKELPQGGSLVAMEQRIEQKYLSYCDTENPIDFMTIWTTRAYLAKSRLWEHYSTYSNANVHQTDAQRDAALALAFCMLECDTKIMTSPLTKGYSWHLQSYFPFPAYIHIVQDLRRRPLSTQAERAWEVMSSSYEVRFPTTGPGLNPLIIMFDRTVLLAWDALETALGSSVEPLNQPRIISSIKKRGEELMQTTQNADTEDPGEVMTADVSNFLASVPMGLPDDRPMFSSGGQDGFTGTNTMAYPSMAGQGPMAFGVSQFQWPPMSWGGA